MEYLRLVIAGGVKVNITPKLSCAGARSAEGTRTAKRFGRQLQRSVMHHPWQMSKNEWDAERERIRPNTAQSRVTRASKSGAIARAKRLEWLINGVNDAAKNQLRRAQKGEIEMSTEYAAELLDQLSRLVTHRRVVMSAIDRGEPVPNHVKAEYE